MMKMKFKYLLVGLLLSSALQAAPTDARKSFGRLFSKPVERSNLDLLRQNQKLKTIAEPIEPAHPVITELPETITLQGYVKRNDGKGNTLWINHQAVQENSDLDNAQVGRLHQLNSKKGGNNASVDIHIPATGKRIQLKAGQMYEPETNQIKELTIVEKEKRLRLQETGTETSGTIADE